jgi:hypothetical protein
VGDICKKSIVSATGLGSRYFPPMTTRVSTFASHVIACATAGTNHKTVTSLCAVVASSRWHGCGTLLQF